MNRLTGQILIIALLLVGLIGGILYANSRRDAATQADEKPVVMATIFPIYDIARNVAGGAVDVALLLPPGASPHTFEPSPKTLRTLEQSRALYAVGHGLDDWALRLSGGTQTPVVILDNGIALRAGEHNETDPHYWLTIPNGKHIAQTIADDLIGRFPEHEGVITQNLSGYLTQLDQAEEEIRAIIREDVENPNLITLHDAWYYFSDHYGLNIVGTFEPSAGREPTPRSLTSLTEALQNSGTNTIYAEPQIPTQSLKAFVADNNLTIADLDPVGGVPGRHSYLEMMRYNAQTLAQNQ